MNRHFHLWPGATAGARHKSNHQPRRRTGPAAAGGFTLLELLIVLMILVAVAGTVVALFGTTFRDSQGQGTLATMAQLRQAIIGTPDLPGYQADTAAWPTTLADLFVQPAALAAYDPTTRRGWRGPYILNPTGTDNGLPTMLDAWGHPIVLQVPAADPTCARLVSPGPDGVMQTPAGTAMPTKSECGDDLVIFLAHSDDRQ